MKFKQSEHDEFQSSILKCGWDYSKVTFTKKKGWLEISVIGVQGQFRYHRKTESRLNENGQFVSEDQFFVDIDNEKSEFLDWSLVITAFEAWLTTTF